MATRVSVVKSCATAGRCGRRSGHVLQAAGIRHGVPAFRPAAPDSRRSPDVPFPGQAERRPGDPAGLPGAVRDQHPSGGYVSDHIGLRARLSLAPTG